MFMNFEGTKYSYDIYGHGEPVLLLHGFTGSKRTWFSFIQNWQEHFQLIVLDLPGHGETVTRKNVSMEVCCHAIAMLLKELNITKITVVGYSMGGRTALSFAMLFPEMVKKLVLESASPGIADDEKRQIRQISDDQLAEKLVNEGMEAFVDFWGNIPLFASQKVLPEEVKRNIYLERISQLPEGLARSLRGMGTGSQPSWWQQLDKLSCPILLIVGALDEKFVTINKQIQIKLANSKLEIVSGVGHAVHIEQPRIFGKLVEEFIIT